MCDSLLLPGLLFNDRDLLAFLRSIERDLCLLHSVEQGFSLLHSVEQDLLGLDSLE